MELLAQNKLGDFTNLYNQESNICQIHSGQKRFVTFLKMGAMKSENVNIPFTVTWSSNTLPISNFGKLELTFHIGFCEAVSTI